MGKLCKACGEEPRMVSPNTGKELTMCAGCQRDYWSNYKSEKAARTTRFCKTCRTNKPASQFLKTSRMCQDCHQQRQMAAQQTLTPDATRFCQACKETKPLADFRRQGNYHQALCIPCYDARKAEMKRRQEEGLPALKRLQFRGPAPLANGYPNTPAKHKTPLAAGVLLVDRERGQVILCQVESEIPMSAKRLEEIVSFYRERGHRIVDAVERVWQDA